MSLCRWIPSNSHKVQIQGKHLSLYEVGRCGVSRSPWERKHLLCERRYPSGKIFVGIGEQMVDGVFAVQRLLSKEVIRVSQRTGLECSSTCYHLFFYSKPKKVRFLLNLNFILCYDTRIFILGYSYMPLGCTYNAR